MTKVNTVLGPVPVSQLGLVLMHEHPLACLSGWDMDARNVYDRERDIESVSRQLAALPEYGIKTVVDATPVDLGRDVEFMVEVSKRSGVNIIASTGLRSMAGEVPRYFRAREVDDIADWMAWELTQGMSRTGIRASAIKVASSLGKIGRHEEKVIRAAAHAHKRTGAPILTHTENGTMGKEQVDLFEEEGVDLSRVLIGHCCGNSDLRYHLDILKRGANVGIDRIGGAHGIPDEVRRGLVLSAIAAGFASQVALSHDIVGVAYGARPDYVRPQRAYTDVMTDFIPKLREAGVSERSIAACMVDLPRKFFGG